jgi:hypothetical protein
VFDFHAERAAVPVAWRSSLANLPVTLSQIEKINVSGGQLPPPEGEETLDTQPMRTCKHSGSRLVLSAETLSISKPFDFRSR